MYRRTAAADRLAEPHEVTSDGLVRRRVPAVLGRSPLFLVETREQHGDDARVLAVAANAYSEYG
jgi:hypothetical protein